MKKCDCYAEKTRVHNDPFYFMPVEKIVGVCFGTKDCEQCNCEGDESKCDFYPEKREAALKKEEVKAEFVKACEMSFKELICHIIDEVSTRRNISLTIFLSNEGHSTISVYPYTEESDG